MRKFNDFEKDIIKAIADEKMFVGNFIDKYLSRVRIKINQFNNTVELLFQIEKEGEVSIEESMWLPRRASEIGGIIFSVVNLLELLEREGWITVLRIATIPPTNEFEFGQGFSNMSFTTNHIQDEALRKKFIRFCIHSIMPNTEIISFVANGFMTDEEIRFNKQEETQQKNNEITLQNSKDAGENIKLADKSLSIANSSKNAAWAVVIITLIVALIEHFDGIKIRDYQFENLAKKFDKISMAIDSVKLKHDTINAHVFSLKDSVKTINKEATINKSPRNRVGAKNN
jgi:hypothetical protein